MDILKTLNVQDVFPDKCRKFGRHVFAFTLSSLSEDASKPVQHGHNKHNLKEAKRQMGLPASFFI